jgi:hypothetical protein
MRNILLFIIFSLTLLSCNTPTEKINTPIIESTPTSKIVGPKFFTYDSIDYYLNDYDEEKLSDLYDNQSKSVLDSIKMGVLLGDIPKSISDLSFINWLDKIGYKKSSLDKSKFPQIDSIFVEKSPTDIIVAACIQVYRDILIFKKNGKVIGTAKICFDCDDHQIYGTKVKTDYFGQNGDFGRLANLLRK